MGEIALCGLCEFYVDRVGCVGVVGCVCCWPALEIVLCCHPNGLIKRLLAQQMPFICFSYVCQRENDLHNNYHISYQTTHEISEGCTQLALSVNNVGMGMEWEKCVNCAIIFIYKYLEMGCQESIKQLWSFGCVYGI